MGLRSTFLAAALLVLSIGAAAAEAQQRPTVRGAVRDTTPRIETRDPADTTGADPQKRREGEQADEPARTVDADVSRILEQLRQLEGFVSTEYEGDRAVYRAGEGVLRLHGRPRVQREGSVLAAEDSIVYFDQRQFVEAYGRPTVRGEEQELEGDILYYDLARSRATALGARTQVSQGATWWVRGNVTLEEAQRIYATEGTFTTDDREEPQYHFQSDRIKVIRDRVLVAAPARLFFGKVPVAWIPFIVHDLERGRRSGLLAPEFGMNDIIRNSSGYTREISNIGFYWAVNDYLGAQLAGAWRSGTYTSLRGTLDWNWRRRFLSGNASVQQYWTQTGTSQLAINGSTSWRPDERTRLSGSADYASSSQFLRQVSTDPREVTQDLASNLQMSRNFDWGSLSLGATRRQNVNNGSVTGTLPQFNVNPRTFTLFRAQNPEQASWYNNAQLQLGLDGSRSFRSGQVDFESRQQDETQTRLNGGLRQLSFGNFTLSATGTLDQRLFQRAEALNDAGEELVLEQRHEDRARWEARASYQQNLIGQTNLTPSVSLDREIRRDTLSGAEYVQGPMRMSLSTGLSSALFGFYPGVGPYSAIRHRLSPRLAYSYSPQVEQTELQERVFGRQGGTTRNRVSLTLNQTWEAKMRPRPERGGEGEPADTAGAGAPGEVPEEAPAEAPEDPAEEAPAEAAEQDPEAALEAGAEDEPEEGVEPGPDTPTGDPGRGGESAPAEAEKVTLLSIDTSPLEYDFEQAAQEGNGFVTERISNTISSDFLRGLTIRMEHELFDRSGFDPNAPENQGRLGALSPRLLTFSTAFSLGPSSAVVQWIQDRLGIHHTDAPAQGTIPGSQERDEPNPEGTGAATNNPDRMGNIGGGPWRVSLDYRFSRGPRTFTGDAPPRDDLVQTVNAQMSFALTPNWALNWNTDYSITDREFGSHRLVLRRDLYRWEADFSFNLTPYGNTSFNMLVRLKDLPDLKFDYRDRNVGIDQRGGGRPVSQQ